MKKADVVRAILQDRWRQMPREIRGTAFAPTNIALCKYWGKRDTEINLPVTSSLSVSLGDKGATVTLTRQDRLQDEILLNDQRIENQSRFGARLIDFLDLFREKNALPLSVQIQSNIPIAAGLASSACGFASVIKALNVLFGWEATPRELSLLARLGSGSAARSIWSGFVEWHAGVLPDGSDSYAELLPQTWPELRVGLVIVSAQEKSLSSREAMLRTVTTSPLYSAWPHTVAEDLVEMKKALQHQDFQCLGEAAESNAMAMHATMLSAWPPIQYAMPETLLAMQKVWTLRQAGLSLYFTQDAGPNIKLLFLQKDAALVQSHFAEMTIVQPFI